MSSLLRKSMAKSSTLSSNTIPEGEVSDSSSSASSAGTIVPPTNSTAAQPPPTSSAVWHKYFEQELYLEPQSSKTEHSSSSYSQAPSTQYHVYLTPPRNPSKDPLFVCQHGAGSCGLSYALFAAELRRRMPSAGVLSVEAREHGSVVQTKTGEPDLSIDTLGDDLATMVHLTAAKEGWNPLPNMVIIGHSLGGGIIGNVAKRGLLGNKVVGYVVIDAVEGFAMDGLKGMQFYLDSRPTVFQTVEAASDWHVRRGTIRNPESSAISTPPQLKWSPEQNGYTWRTDLSSTKRWWENWFTGLSSNFLTAKGAKLLILAGTDRLDKELMIGQMQGKFQLSVFPEAGHFVQEDMPEKTADVVVEFYKRNDRSELVLPPKVDDLIKQGKKV